MTSFTVYDFLFTQGKDDKKKKKKGESDVELQHMPAEYTTITTFQIPLEDILEMEYEFENVFRKNNEGDEGFVTPASVMMDSAIRKVGVLGGFIVIQITIMR